MNGKIRFDTNYQETEMKNTSIVLTAALVLAFTARTVAQQQDENGCKDHPMFTRMPGYWIHNCQDKQFDSFAFVTGKGQTVSVEGRLWTIDYYPQATLKPMSSELQIQRNFQNAIQQQDGQVIWSEKGRNTYKLLKADPALKVFVVGYTDSVSTVEVNLKLSMDQAQAVMQALISPHGISPARLRTYGCGPFASAASNDTEEGRAKNRRVELVKQ
jgi:hypothetical protein